jgi:hypothetical protein
MAFKSSLADSGRRVPETDRLVIAAGRKKPAVGCKGHAIDVTPAKYLKNLVYTLLVLLVQKFLAVPADRTLGLGLWTGFLALEALTDVRQVCAGRSPCLDPIHSLIVMSTPPDARVLPSAEKATEKT